MKNPKQNKSFSVKSANDELSNKTSIPSKKHRNKDNIVEEYPPEIEALYNSLKRGPKHQYTVVNLIKDMMKEGINVFQDKRFKELSCDLKEYQEDSKDSVITLEYFVRLILKYGHLLRRGLEKTLAIPDFQNFSTTVEMIYKALEFNNNGKVRIISPQMFPDRYELWSVVLHSIDGQQASYGQAEKPTVLWSLNKVFLYGLALELLGADLVHEYVSVEFIEMESPEVILNPEGIPYNPLSDSGALVICSLILFLAFKKVNASNKFENYVYYLKSLCMQKKIYFNNTMLLYLKDQSEQIRSVAYLLKAKHCLPPGSDVEVTLEFYLQTGSIEMTGDEVALMGATLANNGINPISNKKIYSESTNKCLLTVMKMCGFSNNSEQFCLQVGMPVKSSKTGQILMIIPGFVAFSLYSPLVNELGISVRGKEFCFNFAADYCTHPIDYEVYLGIQEIKTDSSETHFCGISCPLFAAAASGDVPLFAKILNSGYNICSKDHMKRTVLHIAVSKGNLHLVKYILTRCPSIVDIKDRLEKTALDDAELLGQLEIFELLNNWNTIKQAGLKENVKKFLCKD